MTDKELRTTQYIPTIAPFLYREKLIKALDARYYASPIAQRVCDDIITYIKVFRGADADVVEVVRCKDCKNFMNTIGVCYKFKSVMTPTDYCSKGKRKESE